MEDINLIRKIAWSFHHTTGHDWDDLFQEGALAYLECLAKYKADFMGLNSWFKLENNVSWEKYDLIWIYLGQREMNPAWYVYPRLIRNKAPHAKIVFNVDYEGFWFNKSLDLRFILAWENADVMHVITKWGYEYFKTKLPKVVYGHFGRPYAGGLNTPSPTPFTKRSGISFIRHTNIPSMITEFEVAKQSHRKIKAIDSVPQPFSDGSYLKQLGFSYDVKGDYYPRLEMSKYLEVIGSAYVGLCNHVGVSRFSWDCMEMGVPVVHNEYSEWGNNLFPSLTAKHNNADSFVKLIQKVRKEWSKQQYFDCVLKSITTANKKYSVNILQKKLDKFIKDLMT